MSLAGTYVRVLLTASVVTSVMATAACTVDFTGGQTSAICANQFTYESRTYQDVANAEFTVGEELGSATQPPCDDTGGRDKDPEPAMTKTAYAVDGISPGVAVALGDSPEEATLFAVYAGSELPPEVRRLMDASQGR